MKTGVAAFLLVVVLGAMMVEHSEASIIKALILAKHLKGKKEAVVKPKVVEVPAPVPVARKTGVAKPVAPEPAKPGHVEATLAKKTELLDAAVDTAGATAKHVVATKTEIAKTGVAALGKGKGIIGSTIDKLIGH